MTHFNNICNCNLYTVFCIYTFVTTSHYIGIVVAHLCQTSHMVTTLYDRVLALLEQSLFPSFFICKKYMLVNVIVSLYCGIKGNKGHLPGKMGSR